MNMPRDRAVELGADTFVFASSDGASVSWLSHALGNRGAVVAVPLDARIVDERIAMLTPQAVFLDFSPEHAVLSGEIHQRLKRDWPALPILGTGSSSAPTGMLAALRAGVDDFVDTSASPADAAATLEALLIRRRSEQAVTRGRIVAVLGARPGLGTTTLAASLALCLQELQARSPQHGSDAPVMSRRGVALLDLGLPARDGLLYLNTQSNFSFVDGVHSLRRLDQTLVQTALAHHASGVAMLPLPASLAQVREISHAESVALIKRLGDFFDFQIADLGGFSTIDFIAQTVREADKTWLVCDQSIGAIVSTANLIKELTSRGLELQRFALVVNKFDPGVGLAARDIASRLGIPLAHVLPARSTALLAAASRGEMLVRSARHDAYVHAVQGMARGLHQEYLGAAGLPPASDSRWGALMAQLTGKWKSAKEG